MPDPRTRPLDHWVCIPDDDLAYILDFDSHLDGLKDRDLFEWIEAVQDIIEDGLETA